MERQLGTPATRRFKLEDLRNRGVNFVCLCLRLFLRLCLFVDANQQPPTFPVVHHSTDEEKHTHIHIRHTGITRKNYKLNKITCSVMVLTLHF